MRHWKSAAAAGEVTRNVLLQLRTALGVTCTPFEILRLESHVFHSFSELVPDCLERENADFSVNWLPQSHYVGRTRIQDTYPV